MKNNGRFTYNELLTIYHSLQDSMTLINKSYDFDEEDKDVLIKDIRDVAHKVMLKLEAMEDGDSC